jgi:hypothetical protein
MLSSTLARAPIGSALQDAILPHIGSCRFLDIRRSEP